MTSVWRDSSAFKRIFTGYGMRPDLLSSSADRVRIPPEQQMALSQRGLDSPFAVTVATAVGEAVGTGSQQPHPQISTECSLRAGHCHGVCVNPLL